MTRCVFMSIKCIVFNFNCLDDVKKKQADIIKSHKHQGSTLLNSLIGTPF